MSPEGPGLRLARATVFATVCVVVSAGGHVFAGGKPVAPGVLILGSLGTLALAYLLGGRERGPQVVLGATIAAQILLHELFSGVAPVAVSPDAHAHSGLGMTLAHLVVAVVTGWWLYRGENAFWLMVRLWGMPPLPVLRWLLVLSTGESAPVRQAVPESEPRVHCSLEFAAAVHRRGPPMLSRAL
ncbi:MFS transporter [Nonomuraea sediminis]|uniref:MFS transporter n=1 Tax=Nonomuraea sediminis TaxID=2835864 RepID=UPI001BDD5AFC|nr:MFS transporter [Nonomuraea sediminis]